MTDRESVLCRASVYHGVEAGWLAWGRPMLICMIGGRILRLSFRRYDDAVDCQSSVFLWLLRDGEERTDEVLDRCLLSRFPLGTLLAAYARKVGRGLLSWLEP